MRRVLGVISAILSVFAACSLSYLVGERSVACPVCPEPVVCPDQGRSSGENPEGATPGSPPVSAPEPEPESSDK